MIVQYTISSTEWTAISAAPLIVPAGTKICVEIDNNYTDVISFTLGLVWYEI